MQEILYRMRTHLVLKSRLSKPAFLILNFAKKLKKKNNFHLPKTLCVYPWIHQMTTPSGKVNFCCISPKTFVKDDNGKPYQLGTHSFSDAWNSSYMRGIRKNMLRGEPVKGCETCYKQEKIGKKSYRETHNEEWRSSLGNIEVNKRIEDSRKNNFNVVAPPVYLDLRLGNLCNLKCRMCNPYNSTQIHKEWTELDASTDGDYSKFWANYKMKNESFDPWYESEIFWNDIATKIPHLKKVYMTGGEPTLIEANYKFLDKCKEMGFAREIELFFNLNFTNIRDRFIDQLSHFRWTNINASIDGFGVVNDYIRGSSKWSVCSGNIEKLLEKSSHNVGLGFSPVIQAYNILYLPELLDYIESLVLKYKRDILVDFLHCYSPEFLDFAILPANIKNEAKIRLIQWKSRSKTFDNGSRNSFFLKNSIDSLITRLDQTMETTDDKKIHDFIHYTKILDAKRNQSCAQSLPDLVTMLKEAHFEF